MKVAVIGAGAIGLLISFYLCEAGHEVTVVTRTVKQREALQKKGINLYRDKLVKNKFVNVCTFSDISYKNNDLWIVALKQYDLTQFFERWQDASQLPPILFLQNGLGHLEKAEKSLNTKLLAGSITHGAMKKSDTEVVHTGMGEIVFGDWKDASLSGMIVDKLQNISSFPMVISDNISYILKRKLLVNLVVNPLTALYQVRNGELLENKYFAENAKDVFSEGIRALQLGEEEWSYVVQVIKNTAENESSMLRDMKLGRKTEIDAITGHVLQVGKERGLSLPFVQFLHRSINGLERGGE